MLRMPAFRSRPAHPNSVRVDPNERRWSVRGPIGDAETAPSFLARSLRDNALAVTEIKCDIENNGLTAPIPCEDALLVARFN